MCKRNQTLSGSSYGMKWHKFLLFCLLLGGIVNLIVGGMSFISLLAVDATTAIILILSGAICVAQGVFNFVVHGRLKGLYANGPKLLVAMYIFQLVTGLVNSIVPSILSPELYPLDSSTITGTITGAIVAIAINSAYYKKRADMFTN